MRRLPFVTTFVALTALVACADSEGDATGDDAFSSNQATLLDFEFDGSLVTDTSLDDKKTIESQLLFTIGHLNNDNGVGRIDNLVLTNVVRNNVGGRVELTYHAKLPVAWGAKTKLPTTYEFKLPKDVSGAAQQKFANAHKKACVDDGAHDVSAGSMWYHYRPQRPGCDITDAEVIKTTARATRSALNTTGRFPEYHKIWEDNRLEVVSIFAKFAANADSDDEGIDAFNGFVRRMKSDLRDKKVVTTPPTVSDAPGPGVRDVTIEATLANGKSVKITAFLVDDIQSVFDGFDARYESLTPTADLITYNGHAGLGDNVRALAKKGRFVANKYQVFFMNGCDTFAYVDGSLAEKRASLNKGDPTGTKFMEFVTNAMPSFFSSMNNASAAIVNGFLSFDQPKTYEQMFQGIDRAEVVLVTGEEDNEFKPGMPIGTK